ncbi:MAG: RNA methyltransferase [Clostridiales bacterium]|nr:RNA methyltransferase [Clostridiales bacterium]
MITTSRTNEIIKRTKKLHRSAGRRESGLHFIEGDKLVLDALASGAAVETVFALPEAAHLVPECIEVSLPVMEALCAAQSVPGLCATVKTPDTSCPDSYPNGFWLALDSLQDPGNLGTILRTADAFGAKGVLISRESADPFAPKALRAAMGSTYHLPIYIGDLEAELPKLNAQGFCCLCGHLNGEENLPPHGENLVLVIGNEGHGVSDAIANLCHRYRLPMRGRAESLNAAIFAAVMMERLLGK